MKKRRLYEGFGVLDLKPETNKEDLIIEKQPIKEAKEDLIIEKLDLKYIKSVDEENKAEKTSLKLANKLEKKQFKTSLISTIKPFNFHSVVGLQQRVMFLLFEHCKQIGSRETNPIGINYFTEKLEISQMNAHNAINELLKKSVIEKTEYKRGRGGYSRYLFSEPNWNILNLNIEKLSLNYINKTSFKTIETPDNSSSKELKLKKELTNQFEIPENLKSIISQKELQKLLEKGLSEENIEFSLKHFSYDLENNLVKSKTGPLNLFFGVVRSGQVYKSLKLIELENEELKEYQNKIKILDNENKQLKENELLKKYQTFKDKNPNFLNEIKENQKMNLSQEILEKIAFNQWKDQNEI